MGQCSYRIPFLTPFLFSFWEMPPETPASRPPCCSHFFCGLQSLGMAVTEPLYYSETHALPLDLSRFVYVMAMNATSGPGQPL